MLSEKRIPYEYMVYPTLQTAWIRGKGLLLFFGLFFMEFGAGLFLAAAILQNLWGQTAGWLISGVLGGGCHFLFLGHPFRVIKAFLKPGKSWISRGLFTITLFQLCGFLHLLLSLFSTPVMWVMVLAVIAAIATILYGGCEIADVKSIRTWNSSSLPVQMLIRSFFIGLAIVLAINLLSGFEMPAVYTKQWLILTFLINFCLFAINLLGLAFQEGMEKLSLFMIIKGSLKWIFWPLVVTGGMIVPLIVSLYGIAIGPSKAGITILLITVILQMIGDLSLRYCVMRSGYYPGLFPARPAYFR
jgi:formate-dependent nitrite reductase membrane component NrfD